MKTITYTIAFLLLLVTFSSCTAEEIVEKPEVQTLETSTVAADGEQILVPVKK